MPRHNISDEYIEAAQRYYAFGIAIDGAEESFRLIKDSGGDTPGVRKAYNMLTGALMLAKDDAARRIDLLKRGGQTSNAKVFRQVF